MLPGLAAALIFNAGAQTPDDYARRFQEQTDSGTVKVVQGDYPGALEHFFEALKISEEENSEENQAAAHSSLGTTYYRLHDWEKALKHLDIAEEVFKKRNDENKLADIYYKKGIVHDEMPGQTAAAFGYLQRALRIYEKENDCSQLADIYNAIAGHYYMQRMTDSVAHYAKHALAKFEECGTAQQQAAMNINIASLLNSQLKHREAETYNLKGIELAREANSYAQLRQGYKNLSETYAYMGQFDQAYKNRVLFDQYKDSVFSADKNKLAAELAAKYEGEKKDKLLAEKEREIAQSRLRLTLLSVGLLCALLLIGMLYYISNQRRLRNRQLRELNATKDKLFSIISHDLKSPLIAQQRALNTIVENLENYDNASLLENLHGFQLAIETQLELLQNLLNWTNLHTGRMKYKPAGFELNEVIREAARLYELTAQNKKIEIGLELPHRCSVYADRQMIQTVVRNLLNNAIKFTNEGGKVTISCSCPDDKAILTIKDNGVGMNEKTLEWVTGKGEKQTTAGTQGEMGSGLGMIICRELLERNGSSLIVKSETGKGSEIGFELTKIDERGM